MEEDFFKEEKVNHVQSFCPDFPTSVIRDVLNRADVNWDIEVACNVLMSMGGNEMYDDDFSHVAYDYDDVEQWEKPTPDLVESDGERSSDDEEDQESSHRDESDDGSQMVWEEKRGSTLQEGFGKVVSQLGSVLAKRKSRIEDTPPWLSRFEQTKDEEDKNLGNNDSLASGIDHSKIDLQPTRKSWPRKVTEVTENQGVPPLAKSIKISSEASSDSGDEEIEDYISIFGSGSGRVHSQCDMTTLGVVDNRTDDGKIGIRSTVTRDLGKTRLIGNNNMDEGAATSRNMKPDILRPNRVSRVPPKIQPKPVRRLSGGMSHKKDKTVKIGGKHQGLGMNADVRHGSVAKMSKEANEVRREVQVLKIMNEEKHKGQALKVLEEPGPEGQTSQDVSEQGITGRTSNDIDEQVSGGQALKVIDEQRTKAQTSQVIDEQETTIEESKVIEDEGEAKDQAKYVDDQHGRVRMSVDERDPTDQILKAMEEEGTQGLIKNSELGGQGQTGVDRRGPEAKGKASKIYMNKRGAKGRKKKSGPKGQTSKVTDEVVPRGPESYDYKRLLISELSEETTYDTLSNYMELISGEDVIGLTFLGQGRAVVDTAVPIDLEKVQTKIKKRMLDKKQLKVELVRICDSILVSGLSPKVTKDSLLLYFENARRSGGGDVKGEVTLYKDKNCAVICFEDPKVIDRVLRKEHTLEKKQLTVEKYDPQISPIILDPSPNTQPSLPTNTTGQDEGDTKMEEERSIRRESESCSDRLNVVCEVDCDIMELIINGKYKSDLEKKLDDCKAEVEWMLGSETATIWKKQDSGYVKKWALGAKTTLLEFLDQFMTFIITIDPIVSPVIPNSLTRLTRDLPKGKALCKVTDNEDSILVVCLDDDKNLVQNAVNKVLEMIKKEETRKTYKKEAVKIKKFEHAMLLEKIKFVGEMREKHSETELNLSKEKQELYMEGPREQFTAIKIQYLQLMNSFVERTFALPSGELGEIVNRKPGQEYLQQKLDSKNIKALVCADEANAIKVVAPNSKVYEQAQKCVFDSIKKDEFKFEPQDTFILESEKYKTIFKELQSNQLICIYADKNKVIFQGMVEHVENVKKKVEELFNNECVRDEEVSITPGFVRLLDEHYQELLKNIESKLKESRISISMNIKKQAIIMSGTKAGLKVCYQCIRDLNDQLVEDSKSYCFPGSVDLLHDNSEGNGKRNRNLRLVEVDKKVIIETSVSTRDGVKNTRREDVDVAREEETEDSESEEEAPVSFQTTLPAAHQPNFTTTSGINVSWVFGKIEKEVADALVNSATSDLNHRTACYRALLKVGGSRFEDACKPHNNVPVGDIVSTSGGKLKCTYVIHAVCCHWNNGNNGTEQILRQLMQKILAECVRLNVTSVAIPAIGTGQHGFPENIVSKIYVEELQKFAPAGRLKQVRIVIFKSGQKTSPQPQATIQPTFPAVVQPLSNQRNASFGLVTVSLHHGDITQQATVVDAIINPLDKSLNLASGGGVNKVILNTGGQTIQQELDNVKSRQRVSVARTSAGNIQCASNILHFLPASTNVQGLQNAIEECFKEAKSLGYRSVSVPAIGTAGFNIAPRDSANLILNAAQNFSASSNYKLQVNIVVFQQTMVPDFEAVFSKHSSAVSSVPQLPVFAAKPTHSLKSSKHHQPKSRASLNLRTLRTGTPEQEVRVRVFAISKQDTVSSLEEVDKIVEKHTTTKEIEQEKAFDVLVKYWPAVERLARHHKVTISCDRSSSSIKICGLISSVSDCKDQLSDLISKHIEEERISVHKKFISKNVQWYYVVGNQNVAYGKELNTCIEMAYMENKGKIEVLKNNVKCEIDLKSSAERNLQTGQVLAILRKHMGETDKDEISIPAHWAPQQPSQVVQLVQLSAQSAEYTKVLSHFQTRGGSGRIVKIERVQNPTLYKAYLVKKQSMQGAENEMQLFHGTTEASITSINANNFNRSFAGINGVAYGNGVYFARDASYSLRYSQPGPSGNRFMYVARVLVGMYTRGAQGMKTPPSKNDPNNPALLYDSLVNDTNNPSIFVVCLDPQCYPEYLITFR